MVTQAALAVSLTNMAQPSFLAWLAAQQQPQQQNVDPGFSGGDLGLPPDPTNDVGFSGGMLGIPPQPPDAGFRPPPTSPFPMNFGAPNPFGGPPPPPQQPKKFISPEVERADILPDGHPDEHPGFMDFMQMQDPSEVGIKAAILAKSFTDPNTATEWAMRHHQWRAQRAYNMEQNELQRKALKERAKIEYEGKKHEKAMASYRQRAAKALATFAAAQADINEYISNGGEMPSEFNDDATNERAVFNMEQAASKALATKKAKDEAIKKQQARFDNESKILAGVGKTGDIPTNMPYLNPDHEDYDEEFATRVVPAYARSAQNKIRQEASLNAAEIALKNARITYTRNRPQGVNPNVKTRITQAHQDLAQLRGHLKSHLDALNTARAKAQTYEIFNKPGQPPNPLGDGVRQSVDFYADLVAQDQRNINELVTKLATLLEVQAPEIDFVNPFTDPEEDYTEVPAIDDGTAPPDSELGEQGIEGETAGAPPPTAPPASILPGGALAAPPPVASRSAAPEVNKTVGPVEQATRGYWRAVDRGDKLAADRAWQKLYPNLPLPTRMVPEPPPPPTR